MASQRIKWLALQVPKRWKEEFWPQPYEQLAKVLREMGHGEDAKDVLIEKEETLRRAEYARLGGWQAKWPHAVLTWMQRLVGYGYRPEWALAPASLVVLIGCGIILVGNRSGVMLEVDPPAEPKPILQALAYSIESFVPLVELGQVEAFRPDMTGWGGWWLQVYLWVHGFLGWLIGGLAVAGILGLFRRD